MYTFDWVVKSRVVPSGKPRVVEVGVITVRVNNIEDVTLNPKRVKLLSTPYNTSPDVTVTPST